MLMERCKEKEREREKEKIKELRDCETDRHDVTVVNIEI